MRNNIKIHPKLHIQKLEDIYKEPITIRVNKFDEEAFEEFSDDFEEAINTEQPIIPIVIDSFGGSSYGVIGMINLIETCPVPVATILLSKAMSAGAILFAFGTEGYRFMHPDASMMIHDVASMTGGKVEDIKADTKNMDEMNQRIYQRMSLHLGHKSDYLGNLIKEHNHVDWYLTAKDAKKHKIANHLKLPNYNIEINLNVTFG
jgi:ATP-dependent Clp protease protease subunit